MIQALQSEPLRYRPGPVAQSVVTAIRAAADAMIPTANAAPGVVTAIRVVAGAAIAAAAEKNCPRSRTIVPSQGVKLYYKRPERRGRTTAETKSSGPGIGPSMRCRWHDCEGRSSSPARVVASFSPCTLRLSDIDTELE